MKSLRESPRVSSENGKPARLNLPARIGLVLLGVIVVLGVRSFLPEDPVKNANNQEQAAPPSSPVAATPAAQSVVANSPDEELSRILRDLEGAPHSSHVEVIRELELSEQKHPTDYRFPYERAKLSTVGGIAHEEVFKALVVAAERAISSGKAKEMLNALMADRDIYFEKTSQEHGKWNLLVGALKEGNRNRLTELSASLKKKGEQ